MKIKSPPLHSDGLQLYKSKPGCIHTIDNSLGYIVCAGNDFGTQNICLITSTCFGNGHGKSILKKHFVDWCMIFSIRRLPNIKWYNYSFPYFQPRNY